MRPDWHNLRLHFLTGLVISCCVGAASLLTSCDRGSHPTLVGNPAPDFTVTDGSRTVTLSQLRGQVVLLNFWATWCAPCIEEIPSLESLQKQMPQVKVFAVSTDKDNADYAAFISEHKLGFDNVHDPSGHSNALYGTVAFPESYVIDRNGVVLRRFIGPQDWTSPAITEYLKKL